MMKPNFLSKQRSALPNLIVICLLVMILLVVSGGRGYHVWTSSAAAGMNTPAAAAPQFAPARPWTAVASSGAVDEVSLMDYAFGTATPADFGFKAASVQTKLVVRYNVTNTFDNNANPNVPGWTTFELGGSAPVSSAVSATLYQIDKCTGLAHPVCSTKLAPSMTCNTCSMPSSTVNFTNFLYVIELTLQRSGAQQPRATTLRIY